MSHIISIFVYSHIRYLIHIYLLVRIYSVYHSYIYIHTTYLTYLLSHMSHINVYIKQFELQYTIGRRWPLFGKKKLCCIRYESMERAEPGQCTQTSSMYVNTVHTLCHTMLRNFWWCVHFSMYIVPRFRKTGVEDEYIPL